MRRDDTSPLILTRKRCILSRPIMERRKEALFYILWIWIISIDSSWKEVALDAVWIADANFTSMKTYDEI